MKLKFPQDMPGTSFRLTICFDGLPFTSFGHQLQKFSHKIWKLTHFFMTELEPLNEFNSPTARRMQLESVGISVAFLYLSSCDFYPFRALGGVCVHRFVSVKDVKGAVFMRLKTVIKNSLKNGVPKLSQSWKPTEEKLKAHTNREM